MVRYQAYAWNGKQYYPISTPKYRTADKAKEAAESIISDRQNESVMPSIRKHYKEKPIIVKEDIYGSEDLI